jgi:hypothetical protein
MFRPDGPHLCVRREFAPGGRVTRPQYGGFLLRGEINERLVLAGQLEQHTRKVVLHLGRQAANRFDGMFEQFRHARIIGRQDPESTSGFAVIASEAT